MWIPPPRNRSERGCFFRFFPSCFPIFIPVQSAENQAMVYSNVTRRSCPVDERIKKLGGNFDIGTYAFEVCTKADFDTIRLKYHPGMEIGGVSFRQAMRTWGGALPSDAPRTTNAPRGPGCGSRRGFPPPGPPSRRRRIGRPGGTSW